MVGHYQRNGDIEMARSFNLTTNELRATIALTESCLAGMGGTRPSDLEYDEYTWVSIDDLIAAGWSRHEAAGTFSALADKGVIYEYEEDQWVLDTEAWRYVDTIWDDLDAK